MGRHHLGSLRRARPGPARHARHVLYGGGSGGAGSLADTWSFDGEKWEELKLPGPPARSSPALAYDAARDRIVLFGGRRAWPDDLADTWLFDGNAWTEVAPH